MFRTHLQPRPVPIPCDDPSSGGCHEISINVSIRFREVASWYLPEHSGGDTPAPVSAPSSLRWMPALPSPAEGGESSLEAPLRCLPHRFVPGIARLTGRRDAMRFTHRFGRPTRPPEAGHSRATSQRPYPRSRTAHTRHGQQDGTCVTLLSGDVYHSHNALTTTGIETWEQQIT